MDFDKLLVSTKFSPPHIGSRFIARKRTGGQVVVPEAFKILVIQ